MPSKLYEIKDRISDWLSKEIYLGYEWQTGPIYLSRLQNIVSNTVTAIGVTTLSILTSVMLSKAPLNERTDLSNPTPIYSTQNATGLENRFLPSMPKNLEFPMPD
jgi:hypothetical protein